jgi:hypothetical protein
LILPGSRQSTIRNWSAFSTAAQADECRPSGGTGAVATTAMTSDDSTTAAANFKLRRPRLVNSFTIVTPADNAVPTPIRRMRF